MYESGGAAEATNASASASASASATVTRGSRPWLAADGCFQDVVASLPGGSTLAQVLPTLLTLEPAALVTMDPTALLPGTAGPPAQRPFDDGGQHEAVWSPADPTEREWSAGEAGAPWSTAEAEAPWSADQTGSSDGVGSAGENRSIDEIGSGGDTGPAEPWGPGDGLPVWLTALQQCLEPLPAVATIPAAVGSAPVRSGPVPAGGLVDPARSERQQDRAAESLASMSTAAVIEVVAGFKRIEAWAASQAARAAAHLATRPELRPDARRPVPAGAAGSAALRAPALAATTLAKRLGTSERTAGLLVHAGLALTGTLYATGDALDRGAIDWTKSQIIAAALAGVPWQVAHAIEDRVLPTAPARTPGKLRQDLAKALLEVDPEDAAARYGRARRERRVERPVALPDGMALVRAVLPADAAVRLDVTLQAAATCAKAAGDPRTMDQLRADGLDALAMQAWYSGFIEASPRPGTSPGMPTAVAAAPAGRGSAGPGGRGSAGPANGSLAQALGPAAHGAPRERMRLSHTRKRAQINVTVDLTTLLGLNEKPGHLAGYGPIGADMARRLSQDGTWRRLLTDPVTGLVVDVSTKRYRPPENLAELVRLRHPTCIDPVCSVPSDRCDVDHQEAWNPANSNTVAGNLGPLCRTHHLHKTHAGAGYRETGPGIHEITTPTGHRYRTGPPDTGRPDPGRPDPGKHDPGPPPF